MKNGFNLYIDLENYGYFIKDERVLVVYPRIYDKVEAAVPAKPAAPDRETMTLVELIVHIGTESYGIRSNSGLRSILLKGGVKGQGRKGKEMVYDKIDACVCFSKYLVDRVQARKARAHKAVSTRWINQNI